MEQTSENIVKNGQVITVKNADGDADTTATILIQNKINYIPKVSVIIPVYNMELYLHECLDSVLKQTLKKIEIICIDDGSTDKSLDILKEYAQKDKRITIITQNNLHAGVARNAGLTVAKGEYLSFLDSDDFFELNMLEEAYNKGKQNNSDIVIFQFNMKNYSNNTTIYSMGINNEIVSKNIDSFSPSQYNDNVFGITTPTPWNKIFKRQFIYNNNIKYQNLTVCNDLYFVYASITAAKKISIVKKSLLNYRYMQKNSLSNSRQKYPYNFINALNGLYLFIKKNECMDLYRQSFMKTVFSSIMWTANQQISKEVFFKNFPSNKPVMQEFSFLLDIAQNENKKIYLISQPQMIDTTGGAITALINMGKFLKQYNLDVTCMCYAKTTKKPTWANELKFVNLYNYAEGNMDFSDAINKYLTENRPDLLIFFFPMFLRDAQLEAKFDNIPKILMFHSRPDWYIDRMNEQEKLAFKHACKNIFAQVLMPSFIKMLPDYIPKNNVTAIGNIVTNQTEYQPKKQKKKIVYLSRVDKYKGLEFLINSYVRVAKKHPDWELHIYGQSEPAHYVYQLQDIIESYGLSKQIKFMGVVSDVISVLNQYDFCVFPSYFEGFGIGLAEALSCGLPAIGLKGSSAVNEIILDGENGFLCDETYADFSEKINILIEDKKLRQQMGKNAAQSVKQFSAESIYKKWLITIGAILTGKPIKTVENSAQPKKYNLFSIQHIIESSQNNQPEIYTNKISVIIPVYNTEKYLPECLDSVLNQTLTEIEIICINDGSTDESLRILKEYEQKDKRIKIINQKNCGLSCSRNNALKIATGKYVVFVDSDDYIAPNSLEMIYKQMKTYNLDMLSFSGMNFISDTKQMTQNPYWDFLYLPQDFNTTYFNIQQCWVFLHKMAVSSCLTAYKISFIKNNKIYFPDGLCFEDNLFFTKAITKADRCGIIKDKLYFRRIHDASITQNWNAHFIDWVKINDLVLDYLCHLKIEQDILITNINSRCGATLARFEQLDKKDQQKMKGKINKLMNKYNFYKTIKQTRFFHIKPYLLFPYYLIRLYTLRHSYKKVYVKKVFNQIKTYRIDILHTADTGTIDTIEQNGNCQKPAWMKGKGVMFTNNAKCFNFNILCRESGDIKFYFRGMDCRANNERVAVFVKYKSIKIDGTEILNAPIEVWHDKPFVYAKNVTDEQQIKVEIETEKYIYNTRQELKTILNKLYPNQYFSNKMLKRHINSTKYSKIKALPQIHADAFISVGPACRSAYQLQKANLRQYALPFDWMISQNLNFVIETLKSKKLNWFNYFLEEPSDIKHRHVTDKISGMVSLHHFPKEYSVKDYLPVFHAIFNRRNERFKKILATKPNICFVSFRSDSVAVILKFMNDIMELYNIRFLTFINVRHSDTDKNIYKYKLNDRCVLYDIYANDIHENGNDPKTNRDLWKGNTQLWNNITSKLKLNSSNEECDDEGANLDEVLATINLKQNAFKSEYNKLLEQMNDSWIKQYQEILNKHNELSNQIKTSVVENRSEILSKYTDLDAKLKSVISDIDIKHNELSEQIGNVQNDLMSQTNTIRDSQTQIMYDVQNEMNNKIAMLGSQQQYETDKLRRDLMGHLDDMESNQKESLYYIQNEINNQIDTMVSYNRATGELLQHKLTEQIKESESNQFDVIEMVNRELSDKIDNIENKTILKLNTMESKYKDSLNVTKDEINNRIDSLEVVQQQTSNDMRDDLSNKVNTLSVEHKDALDAVQCDILNKLKTIESDNKVAINNIQHELSDKIDSVAFDNKNAINATQRELNAKLGDNATDFKRNLDSIYNDLSETLSNKFTTIENTQNELDVKFDIATEQTCEDINKIKSEFDNMSQQNETRYNNIQQLLTNLYTAKTNEEKDKLEFRTFGNLAYCIRSNLYKIPEDIDMVVGVPRSGMIPAYIIALFMNKKCCSLDEFIAGIKSSNGFRNVSNKPIKNILVIDDSIFSGSEMSRVREKLSGFTDYNFKYMAVYARTESKDKVDVYLEIVDGRRVWQWNYLNHSIAGVACFDMDGVLCVDPTDDQNDDGEKYIDFIKNAKPLYIPKYKIRAIVTSRLEKYRKFTEEWLAENGVKYDELIMLDLPNAEERRKLACHADFKAEVYKRMVDTKIFIESDPYQAKKIATITGKQVLCVKTDELF